MLHFRFYFLASIIFSSLSFAGLNEDIASIKQNWAVANYQLEGKEQENAFNSLIRNAEQVTKRHVNSADTWIWSGIIKSSYAGITGGLSALKYAKAAKQDLEKSIKIDPLAMNGSAYASLGTLYHKLPAWPISFGSNKKAERMLKKAIAIDPENIDNNYFYADYLLNTNQLELAEKYMDKA
ncbi:MAG: tetratricopeptide (TPR) repeat protein, partial [Gammaproteobacteria bacterium]